MKVPTYTAQLQRPRQAGPVSDGTAQYVGNDGTWARIRAVGSAARAGWCRACRVWFQKAQIGADNEAQAAAAQLDIELQKIQLEILQNPNMAQAEKNIKTLHAARSRLLSLVCQIVWRVMLFAVARHKLVYATNPVS